MSYRYRSLLVLFRFAFPRAKGSSWNILLLTFVPICTGLIPYLYVLEASARYHPAKRVSKKIIEEKSMFVV